MVQPRYKFSIFCEFATSRTRSRCSCVHSRSMEKSNFQNFSHSIGLYFATYQYFWARILTPIILAASPAARPGPPGPPAAGRPARRDASFGIMITTATLTRRRSASSLISRLRSSTRRAAVDRPGDDTLCCSVRLYPLGHQCVHHQSPPNRAGRHRLNSRPRWSISKS